MTTAGDQHDLYTALVRVAQRLEIYGRAVKLRVQQGAINIDGEQAERRIHCRNSNIDISRRESG